MKQRNLFSLYLARTAVMLSGARRVALLLLLTLLTTATAWAQTYTLESGTLTISGSGTITEAGVKGACSDNKSLIKKVIIESGVTSIGNNAFTACINLASIEVPASVTSIDEYAFYACEGLTSITIPASVTSIGNQAFSGCTGLKSITFASGSLLTTIGESAFNGCYNTNLTSIVIPASVTSIGNSAFESCSNLASVTVFAPTTCTLGTQAFDNCASGLQIKVFSDLVGIYKGKENWSTYTDKITAIGGNCGATATWSLNSTGVLTISGSGDMANYVYDYDSQPWNSYKDNITSVVIESGVTSIGNWAFRDCTGLTSVTIPASVTSIGEYAFYACKGLTSVTIPASVTSIGNSAFKSCYNLTSVTVYSTSCTLGTQAFDNCQIKVFSDLVGIYKGKENWSTYTDKITAIGGNCGATATWSLSSTGVLTISGSGAMTDLVSEVDQPWKDYRTSITSVVIGSGVTSIGYHAFEGCTGLTSVTFDGTPSLETIGNRAFYLCTNLTSIEIPASVTSIGQSAFSACSGLASITFASGSKLKTIGESVFYNCSNTNLTSIEIPASVTSIEDEAFYNCTNLGKTYVLPTTVPTMGSDVFKYCNDENFAIIVPAAKYDDYCSASGWSSYQSKMKNGYTVTCPDVITATGVGPLVQQGETVTLSGTGDIPTGYLFGGYSVKDADGATVNVTETEGVYTFTMPAADVTVTTTWKMLTLADLAELALDETMQDVVKDGKLKMTVTPKNKYWTLACGVDLLLPKGVVVYKARMNSAGTKVELTEIDATTLGGVLKANNGVVIASTPGESYDLVVSPNNSVTTLSNADAKSYGTDNELEPVLEDTHFTTEDYFILTENKFVMVDISTDTKVPAGKAVLKVAAGSAKTRTLDVIDGETTGIASVVKSGEEEVWYNLQGQRISKPTRKGVYILNGKKVRK